MRKILLLLAVALTGCASSSEDDFAYFDPKTESQKAMVKELHEYYSDCYRRSAALFLTYDASWIDMFCRQEANERMQDKYVRRRI